MTATDGTIVGVIGLGTMGHPMAANIMAVKQAETVRVTARRPESAEDLVADGAQWCDTAASLADGADVVVLMLPDLPEVEQVLAGPEGLLAGVSGPLALVISSTCSPEGVRQLAARLTDQTDGRVSVVDAPVSGGEDGAVAGTLSIMVGGEDAAVARALPTLVACGTPVHLGRLGAGEVAKACNQIIVAATVLSLGESAVLADRSGIDVRAMFDLFAGGYAGSRILATRGPRIADQDYVPSGMAKYMAKDLGFATTVAEQTGTHPALLPALSAAFAELVDAELGDQDIAVTRRFIERR